MVTTSLYCPSCGAHNAIDADICFACQHPLHEPVQETLLHNRYRLLDQLGKGGFGAVHRAEDTHEQGKLVAIKQINLAGLTPQQVIEATDGFNREVSLLSMLSHPHLPHIYEHFTDPDHWYLVMDFLEGETLETYLDKSYTKKGLLTPLPLAEVLDIGLQLCTVLDYLHTREPAVIFRDVKPANIMRTPIGTLYLIDFGIARHYKPGKPKDTIPFGSPGYAAPEQYGKAQTSPCSDIYSLGALLHMLLSGDDPVDNPFHFDPLRLYGSEGVHELTALIERMVSLDVEQRPQRVQEVKDLLQRISDAQTHARILPVSVTPPPPPPTQAIVHSGNGLQQMVMQRQQLRKQRQKYWSYNRRKSRRGFVLGAASTATVILGVGGLTALAHLPYQGPIIGAASSAPATLAPDALFQTPFMLTPQLPEGQSVQAVSGSIDGTTVAVASGTTLRVQAWDASNPYLSHEILMSQHISSPISAVVWNTNRMTGVDMLAFSSETTLYILENVKGSSNHHTHMYQIQAQEPTNNAVLTGGAFAWSPDGKHIAIPFAEGVQLWNVETKTLFRNLLFGELKTNLNKNTPVSSLSWSPDGTFLAAGLNGLKPLIWNVKSGIAYLINSNTLYNTGNIAWSPNGNFIASSLGNRIFVTSFDAVNITLANKTSSVPITTASQVSYSGHRDSVTDLAWSPDGRYIASVSGDNVNNLHVWTPFSAGSGSPPSANPTTLYEPELGHPGDYIFYMTLYQQHTGLTSVCWLPNGISLLPGGDNAYVIPLNSMMLG